MMKQTKQIIFWATRQGDEYTKRNPKSIKELDDLYAGEYGVTRNKMNSDFLKGLKKDIRILEVGANIGLQLEVLRSMGFKNLLGIEINDFAVREAKRIFPQVDVIKGSAFDLPFRDKYFDIVFTSGVLMHISPKDIRRALNEIYRTSRRYIFGFEYFALCPTEVEYRGRSSLLYKRNFLELYLKSFLDLRGVKEKRFPVNGSENITQMFLLKKCST